MVIAESGSVLPTLEVMGLEKSYGPTVALGGVSFTILPGEVHALLGENGAGKSTLVKILSGVIEPDAGTAALDGVPFNPQSILDARTRGVATAFQELSLLMNLTVAENLALPALMKGPLNLISRRRNEERASATLADF